MVGGRPADNYTQVATSERVTLGTGPSDCWPHIMRGSTTVARAGL